MRIVECAAAHRYAARDGINTLYCFIPGICYIVMGYLGFIVARAL